MVTQEHENAFQQVLQAVDSHGARQAFQVLFGIVKDACGVLVPQAEPVVEAVGQSVEDLQAIIADAQAKLAALQASSAHPGVASNGTA